MKTRQAGYATLIATLGCGQPAFCAENEDAPEKNADAHSTKAPEKLGAVPTALRRAARQPGLCGRISDQYGNFKTRMEEDYGLSWSFSLSFRQRRVDPESIGTASQTLFWPSLNLEIFDSETLGAGSFQFMYYGERRGKQRITLNRNGQTLSGEAPDSNNRFSQITYTHTLPGEQLAMAIGQYSFFNFDSNDYLADQQLNFVNSIFSENASSTYAVSGVGAYAQFNANDTLQFLFGGQSVNEEDSAQRPHRVLGSTAYSWLAYAQWKPGFRSLGEAQYSLGIYQASAIDGHAASRGWSINAMQNLSDRWAVFGRLNASHNEDDNSKRSAALGLALNNPLGRSAADQIGIAVGSLGQKILILRQPVRHTQNTLEAYWNVSLHDGWLLTPDIQYIRNPAFAPARDNALIYSLRTTLVF